MIIDGTKEKGHFIISLGIKIEEDFLLMKGAWLVIVFACLNMESFRIIQYGKKYF